MQLIVTENNVGQRERSSRLLFVIEAADKPARLIAETWIEIELYGVNINCSFADDASVIFVSEGYRLHSTPKYL